MNNEIEKRHKSAQLTLPYIFCKALYVLIALSSFCKALFCRLLFQCPFVKEAERYARFQSMQFTVTQSIVKVDTIEILYED